MKTAFLSFIVAVVTCNQSLAIIMPGRFLKKEYDNRKIANTVLARTIADSGVVTVPLIPWNVNAVAITSILRVETLQYIPFAALCYLLPVITIIFGYIENKEISKNYSNTEKSREEV